jgi:Ca2+-binding RTX toxin-like protein
VGAIAVALAAALVALVTVFVLAKPSGAQDNPLITVEPTEVGFGAVEVGTTGDPVRTIYIRNTSGARLEIGGIDILGANAEDFDLVDPLPVGGIILDRDGTYELEVAFTPSANGTRVAELGFNVVGGPGTNVPTVNLSGTGTQEPPTNNPRNRRCTIVGTSSGEVLTGTPRADVICGGGGNDKVNALGGNDTVKGGSGNDRIQSSQGIDRLNGGAGADRITDKAGRRGDRLFGQGGTDVLNAKDRRGGDLLVGGSERDRAFKDRGDRVRSI